tara:strand:- start:1068 stop:1946 length:879 start_codon:yes stop_codon:yes gene_type:complete
VITQPDEPKGRGHQMSMSAVKTFALHENIHVLQPKVMTDSTLIDALHQWEPDTCVVIAFGRILPQQVLDIPRFGCVNLHGSLLPKYRGAAPIQWAICNGEVETGVTSMLMDHGMDTGPILLKRPVAIQPNERASELAHRLANIGTEVILETLDALETDTITPQPQDSAHASLAPILKKKDGMIQWSNNASHIANLVRGMDPWPGAYTYYGTEQWRLWDVEAVHSSPSLQFPGTVLETTRDSITIATGHGTIAIRELQPASRRRMTAHAYLSGHQVNLGSTLTSNPLPLAENN